MSESFIKTVFCAAGNTLLKRRRARLLCDAYAAGHASVLQAWRHHVTAGMPDVIKFIDRLRAIVVTDFTAQDAADAAAIAVKVAANKATKESNKVARNARKLMRERFHTNRRDTVTDTAHERDNAFTTSHGEER
jgi:hypothetical protein